MFSSNCCFLTCIRMSWNKGKVVWYSHLLKNFPQFVVIFTVKCFSIVNEAEVDVFLEFPCFFHHPVNVGNLTSGSSAFSKFNLYVWKFSVHILFKPSLKYFEHYFVSTWNEYSCVLYRMCQDENWPFLVLWSLLSFPNLLAYWVQHFHSIIL